VSRKPRALSDTLVYELYGLTENETRIVEGRHVKRCLAPAE